MRTWLFTLMIAVIGGAIGGLVVYNNHITNRPAIILITSGTIAIYVAGVRWLDILTYRLFRSSRR
jgi:energy-converting hydrogenase Eha subunit C